MDSKMEKIFHKKKLIALQISAIPQGSTPMSGPHEPLQLVGLRRNKGTVVQPHAHCKTKRVTHALQECLVVRKGKLRVTFYGGGKKPLTQRIIKAGEACITLSGGHSIEFLENSEVFEIKNGPFVDDKVPL